MSIVSVRPPCYPIFTGEELFEAPGSSHNASSAPMKFECGPHCLFDKPASSARLYHSRLQASGGPQSFYAANVDACSRYTPRDRVVPFDAINETEDNVARVGAFIL